MTQKQPDESRAMTVMELMAVLAQCDPSAEVVIPCAPDGGPWALTKVNKEMYITGYEDNPYLCGIYVGLGFDENDKFYDADDADDAEMKMQETKDEKQDEPYINDDIVPKTTEDFLNLLSKRT